MEKRCDENSRTGLDSACICLHLFAVGASFTRYSLTLPIMHRQFDQSHPLQGAQMKTLFIDDHDVEEINNLARKLHPLEKFDKKRRASS